MAVRTIATDIKLTGEAAFNDGMKSINNNLKNLRADMAAVSAEFDGNAGSVEALTAKNKLLQESVEQQKVKVDALRQMYEKVKDAAGENSAQADKYRQQLAQATATLHKETAALEKNEAALKAAQKEAKQYTPVTQKMADAVKKSRDKVKDFSESTIDAARHLPVLGELMDVAKVSAKGLGVALNGTKTIASGTFKGMAAAAGGLAKGVGIVTGAAAAGVAAMGAAGVAALGIMTGYAKEAAEAAKTAKEAGEELTASQEQWLAFSDQLDTLDASVASAKSALGGILLPILGDLSAEGAAFLNDFSKDMEAAAGDAGKQGQIMSDYIVKGAKLIKEKLPEYLEIGKELLGSLGEGLSEAAPELLDMGIDVVMDLLDTIIEAAPEMAQAGITLIEKLVASLTEQGPELLTSAVDMVSQIVVGLAQAAPDLIPAAVQLVSQLILALVDASPQLLEAGLQLVFGIISGIASGLGDILGAADQIIQKVLDAFASSDNKFLQIGADILGGIWEGIKNSTEWIYNQISGWIDGIVGWMKKKLDIRSPSHRVEDEVGYQTGIAVGTGAMKAQKAVKRMWGDFLDTTFTAPDLSFNSRLAVAGAGAANSGSKTVNLYFTAKSITEADIRMVVDVVNRKLGEAM